MVANGNLDVCQQISVGFTVSFHLSNDLIPWPLKFSSSVWHGRGGEMNGWFVLFLSKWTHADTMICANNSFLIS
jgi:hypothetical protein